MNQDKNDKSRPKRRGHYPGYTSRFAPLYEDDRAPVAVEDDFREARGEADERYEDYDDYGYGDDAPEDGPCVEDYGLEEYDGYDGPAEAGRRDHGRRKPRQTAGGLFGRLLASLPRFKSAPKAKPISSRKPAALRQETGPAPSTSAKPASPYMPKGKASGGNIKGIVPLPARPAPKPASYLQGSGAFNPPLDDRPSLKGLKLLAAFIVLAMVVYLVTNTLADSLSDNDYTGAVKSTTPPESSAAPDRNYNMELPYMEDLAAIAEANPVIYDIMDNIWRFPTELLELVIKNNETAEFVAEYLEYGKNTAVVAGQIDVSSELDGGVIPHFIQWDRRWGYSYYGTQIMGLDGCGPASLAMVAVGLTGDTRYNPRYVADYSQDHGYITSDNSTTWTLMSVGSKDLGLEPRELTLDANAIAGALKRGEPIIASMGPGDFTTGGHFIVLTGVTAEGKILLNDANSRVNTAQEWDLQRLMGQMKNLWAFTAAGD